MSTPSLTCSAFCGALRPVTVATSFDVLRVHVIPTEMAVLPTVPAPFPVVTEHVFQGMVGCVNVSV